MTPALNLVSSMELHCIFLTLGQHVRSKLLRISIPVQELGFNKVSQLLFRMLSTPDTHWNKLETTTYTETTWSSSGRSQKLGMYFAHSTRMRSCCFMESQMSSNDAVLLCATSAMVRPVDICTTSSSHHLHQFSTNPIFIYREIFNCRPIAKKRH